MKYRALLFHRAQNAINQSLTHPQRLETLTGFGYGVGKLQEGMELYQNATQLEQAQMDAFSQQIAESDAFDQHWQTMQFPYSQHVLLTRKALKAFRATLAYLGLDKARSHTVEGRLMQTKALYFGLRDHPEVHPLLAALGFTLEQIEQGAQAVQRLIELRTQHVGAIEYAASLRKERDAAVKRLDAWLSGMRRHARLAFAAYPEHLDVLGFTPEAPKPKKVSKKATQPPVQPPVQPAGEQPVEEPRSGRPTIEAEKA